MAMGGRLAYFEQLSTREKVLVAGVSVLVLLLVLFIAGLWIQSTIGEIEEEIDANKGLIVDIEVAAEDFLRVKSQCDALRGRLASNPIMSLRIPVNNIARGVTLEGGKKLSDEIGSLEKQVETDLGPICQVDDPKRKKKKKKKKDDDEEREETVVKIEQEFEFRNIPIDSVFGLLQGLEESDELLYVSQIEVRRKFGEPGTAQNAKVTVATYRLHGGL